jgi:hypothetical protein
MKFASVSAIILGASFALAAPTEVLTKRFVLEGVPEGDITCPDCKYEATPTSFKEEILKSHSQRWLGVIHIRNAALIYFVENFGCNDPANHSYNPMHTKPIPGCCDLVFVSINDKDNTEKLTARPIYTVPYAAIRPYPMLLLSGVSGSF